MVASAVLPALWLRDYMSLRMSPSWKAMRRALVYGVAMLVSSAIIWEFSSRIGLRKFLGLVQSPAILVLLIALQIAASAAGIWIKQAQSYNWMWATALLPAPIMWLLILGVVLAFANTFGRETAQLAFFGIGLLWAASIIVAIFRTRDVQMSVEDMDFAVLLGSVSHWLAVCAVSLALSIA